MLQLSGSPRNTPTKIQVSMGVLDGVIYCMNQSCLRFDGKRLLQVTRLEFCSEVSSLHKFANGNS